MLVLKYLTKKSLKASIGEPLYYSETSLFGPEYTTNGDVWGTNHPKRSWFAQITMKNGLIHKVK